MEAKHLIKNKIADPALVMLESPREYLPAIKIAESKSTP